MHLWDWCTLVWHARPTCATVCLQVCLRGLPANAQCLLCVY